MTDRRFVVCLVVFMLMGSQVAGQNRSSQEQESTSVFPLTVGSKWKYRVVNRSTDAEQRVTSEILDKGINLAGDSAFVLWSVTPDSQRGTISPLTIGSLFVWTSIENSAQPTYWLYLPRFSQTPILQLQLPNHGDSIWYGNAGQYADYGPMRVTRADTNEVTIGNSSYDRLEYTRLFLGCGEECQWWITFFVEPHVGIVAVHERSIDWMEWSYRHRGEPDILRGWKTTEDDYRQIMWELVDYDIAGDL